MVTLENEIHYFMSKKMRMTSREDGVMRFRGRDLRMRVLAYGIGIIFSHCSLYMRMFWNIEDYKKQICLFTDKKEKEPL